jgi:hypothetical protein
LVVGNPRLILWALAGRPLGPGSQLFVEQARP